MADKGKVSGPGNDDINVEVLLGVDFDVTTTNERVAEGLKAIMTYARESLASTGGSIQLFDTNQVQAFESLATVMRTLGGNSAEIEKQFDQVGARVAAIGRTFEANQAHIVSFAQQMTAIANAADKMQNLHINFGTNADQTTKAVKGAIKAAQTDANFHLTMTKAVIGPEALAGVRQIQEAINGIHEAKIVSLSKSLEHLSEIKSPKFTEGATESLKQLNIGVKESLTEMVKLQTKYAEVRGEIGKAKIDEKNGFFNFFASLRTRMDTSFEQTQAYVIKMKAALKELDLELKVPELHLPKSIKLPVEVVAHIQQGQQAIQQAHTLTNGPDSIKSAVADGMRMVIPEMVSGMRAAMVEAIKSIPAPVVSRQATTHNNDTRPSPAEQEPIRGVPTPTAPPSAPRGQQARSAAPDLAQNNQRLINLEAILANPNATPDEVRRAVHEVKQGSNEQIAKALDNNSPEVIRKKPLSSNALKATAGEIKSQLVKPHAEDNSANPAPAQFLRATIKEMDAIASELMEKQKKYDAARSDEERSGIVSQLTELKNRLVEARTAYNNGQAKQPVKRRPAAAPFIQAITPFLDKLMAAIEITERKAANDTAVNEMRSGNKQVIEESGASIVQDAINTLTQFGISEAAARRVRGVSNNEMINQGSNGEYDSRTGLAKVNTHAAAMIEALNPHLSREELVRTQHVTALHELTHFGIEQLTPEQFRQIHDMLASALRNDKTGNLHKTIGQVQANYAGESEQTQIKEVLAHALSMHLAGVRTLDVGNPGENNVWTTLLTIVNEAAEQAEQGVFAARGKKKNQGQNQNASPFSQPMQAAPQVQSLLDAILSGGSNAAGNHPSGIDALGPDVTPKEAAEAITQLHASQTAAEQQLHAAANAAAGHGNRPSEIEPIQTVLDAAQQTVDNVVDAAKSTIEGTQATIKSVKGARRVTVTSSQGTSVHSIAHELGLTAPEAKQEAIRLHNEQMAQEAKVIPAMTAEEEAAYLERQKASQAEVVGTANETAETNAAEEKKKAAAKRTAKPGELLKSEFEAVVAKPNAERIATGTHAPTNAHRSTVEVHQTTDADGRTMFVAKVNTHTKKTDPKTGKETPTPVTTYVHGFTRAELDKAINATGVNSNIVKTIKAVPDLEGRFEGNSAGLATAQEFITPPPPGGKGKGTGGKAPGTATPVGPAQAPGGGVPGATRSGPSDLDRMFNNDRGLIRQFIKVGDTLMAYTFKMGANGRDGRPVNGDQVGRAEAVHTVERRVQLSKGFEHHELDKAEKSYEDFATNTAAAGFRGFNQYGVQGAGAERVGARSSAAAPSKISTFVDTTTGHTQFAVSSLIGDKHGLKTFDDEDAMYAHMYDLDHTTLSDQEQIRALRHKKGMSQQVNALRDEAMTNSGGAQSVAAHGFIDTGLFNLPIAATGPYYNHRTFFDKGTNQHLVEQHGIFKETDEEGNDRFVKRKVTYRKEDWQAMTEAERGVLNYDKAISVTNGHLIEHHQVLKEGEKLHHSLAGSTALLTQMVLEWGLGYQLVFGAIEKVKDALGELYKESMKAPGEVYTLAENLNQYGQQAGTAAKGREGFYASLDSKGKQEALKASAELREQAEHQVADGGGDVKKTMDLYGVLTSGLSGTEKGNAPRAALPLVGLVSKFSAVNGVSADNTAAYMHNLGLTFGMNGRAQAQQLEGLNQLLLQSHGTIDAESLIKAQSNSGEAFKTAGFSAATQSVLLGAGLQGASKTEAARFGTTLTGLIEKMSDRGMQSKLKDTLATDKYGSSYRGMFPKEMLGIALQEFSQGNQVKQQNILEGIGLGSKDRVVLARMANNLKTSAELYGFKGENSIKDFVNANPQKLQFDKGLSIDQRFMSRRDIDPELKMNIVRARMDELVSKLGMAVAPATIRLFEKLNEAMEEINHHGPELESFFTGLGDGIKVMIDLITSLSKGLTTFSNVAGSALGVLGMPFRAASHLLSHKGGEGSSDGEQKESAYSGSGIDHSVYLSSDQPYNAAKDGNKGPMFPGTKGHSGADTVGDIIGSTASFAMPMILANNLQNLHTRNRMAVDLGQRAKVGLGAGEVFDAAINAASFGMFGRQSRGAGGEIEKLAKEGHMPAFAPTKSIGGSLSRMFGGLSAQVARLGGAMASAAGGAGRFAGLLTTLVSWGPGVSGGIAAAGGAVAKFGAALFSFPVMLAAAVTYAVAKMLADWKDGHTQEAIDTNTKTQSDVAEANAGAGGRRSALQRMISSGKLTGTQKQKALAEIASLNKAQQELGEEGNTETHRQDWWDPSSPEVTTLTAKGKERLEAANNAMAKFDKSDLGKMAASETQQRKAEIQHARDNGTTPGEPGGQFGDIKPYTFDQHIGLANMYQAQQQRVGEFITAHKDAGDINSFQAADAFLATRESFQSSVAARQEQLNAARQQYSREHGIGGGPADPDQEMKFRAEQDKIDKDVIERRKQEKDTGNQKREDALSVMQGNIQTIDTYSSRVQSYRQSGQLSSTDAYRVQKDLTGEKIAELRTSEALIKADLQRPEIQQDFLLRQQLINRMRQMESQELEAQVALLKQKLDVNAEIYAYANKSLAFNKQSSDALNKGLGGAMKDTDFGFAQIKTAKQELANFMLTMDGKKVSELKDKVLETFSTIVQVASEAKDRIKSIMDVFFQIGKAHIDLGEAFIGPGENGKAMAGVFSAIHHEMEAISKYQIDSVYYGKNSVEAEAARLNMLHAQKEVLNQIDDIQERLIQSQNEMHNAGMKNPLGGEFQANLEARTSTQQARETAQRTIQRSLRNVNAGSEEELNDRLSGIGNNLPGLIRAQAGQYAGRKDMAVGEMQKLNGIIMAATDGKMTFEQALKSGLLNNPAFRQRLMPALQGAGIDISKIVGDLGGNGQMAYEKAVKVNAEAVTGSAGSTSPYSGPGGGLYAANQIVKGGVITSGFGQRPGEFHKGIDIGGHYGAPVTALKGGKVVSVGGPAATRDWGKDTIIVQQDDGSFALYGHNSASNVKAGDIIKPGQQIANVGHSGAKVHGDHVHFEERRGGKDFWTSTAYDPRTEALAPKAKPQQKSATSGAGAKPIGQGPYYSSTKDNKYVTAPVNDAGRTRAEHIEMLQSRIAHLDEDSTLTDDQKLQMQSRLNRQMGTFKPTKSAVVNAEGHTEAYMNYARNRAVEQARSMPDSESEVAHQIAAHKFVPALTPAAASQQAAKSAPKPQRSAAAIGHSIPGMSASGVEKLAPYVEKESKGQGVPMEAIWSVLSVESGANPNVANSSDGAVGPMQIMPSMHNVSAAQAKAPASAIAIGTKILKDYAQQAHKFFPGDKGNEIWARAGAMYLMGPGGWSLNNMPNRRDRNGKGINGEEYMKRMLDRMNAASGGKDVAGIGAGDPNALSAAGGMSQDTANDATRHAILNPTPLPMDKTAGLKGPSPKLAVNYGWANSPTSDDQALISSDSLEGKVQKMLSPQANSKEQGLGNYNAALGAGTVGKGLSSLSQMTEEFKNLNTEERTYMMNMAAAANIMEQRRIDLEKEVEQTKLLVELQGILFKQVGGAQDLMAKREEMAMRRSQKGGDIFGETSHFEKMRNYKGESLRTQAQDEYANIAQQQMRIEILKRKRQEHLDSGKPADKKRVEEIDNQITAAEQDIRNRKIKIGGIELDAQDLAAQLNPLQEKILSMIDMLKTGFVDAVKTYAESYYKYITPLEMQAAELGKTHYQEKGMDLFMKPSEGMQKFRAMRDYIAEGDQEDHNYKMVTDPGYRAKYEFDQKIHQMPAQLAGQAADFGANAVTGVAKSAGFSILSGMLGKPEWLNDIKGMGSSPEELRAAAEKDLQKAVIDATIAIEKMTDHQEEQMKNADTAEGRLSLASDKLRTGAQMMIDYFSGKPITPEAPAAKPDAQAPDAAKPDAQAPDSTQATASKDQASTPEADQGAVQLPSLGDMGHVLTDLLKGINPADALVKKGQDFVANQAIGAAGGGAGWLANAAKETADSLTYKAPAGAITNMTPEMAAQHGIEGAVGKVSLLPAPGATAPAIAATPSGLMALPGMSGTTAMGLPGAAGMGVAGSAMTIGAGLVGAYAANKGSNFLANYVGDKFFSGGKSDEEKAIEDKHGEDGGNIGGMVGTVGGGALGFALGGPIGAAIGATAGSAIGTIVGNTIGRVMTDPKEELKAKHDAELKENRDTLIAHSMAEMVQVNRRLVDVTAANTRALQFQGQNFSALGDLIHQDVHLLSNSADMGGRGFDSRLMGMAHSQGIGVTMRGMADGGVVTGGVSGKDSVPTMLMPGEYVMPKKDVDRFRDYTMGMTQTAELMKNMDVQYNLNPQNAILPNLTQHVDVVYNTPEPLDLSAKSQQVNINHNIMPQAGAPDLFRQAKSRGIN